MPLSLLVVSSETPGQQDARRARTGQASHETYADTLRRLAPGCRIDHASCLDGSVPPRLLEDYDGAFFPGSPIQMHEGGAGPRAAASFMTALFEAGVPAFGSCAGLQIATVAAGGTTGPRAGPMVAGIARRITRTEAGRGHPMLAGRPATWDAPAMHASVVAHLPQGGTALARSDGTPVEAAEIRHGRGMFWGVQYHPEIALAEIAQTLRGQVRALTEAGLARDGAAVEDHADALAALDREPGRRDLAWRLGLDGQVTDRTSRTREIVNALGWMAAARDGQAPARLASGTG